MTTGRDIRTARERAGMTQQELARRVGVSLRTVGNWERGETVPLNRAGTLETVLAEWLRGDSSSPRLDGASDAELLAEIARRFERRARMAAPYPESSARAGWDEPDGSTAPVPDHYDLAAYPAPAAGTLREQWDEARSGDGEESQAPGGDEPA